MNEMAEPSKLLMKAIRNTYKKVNKIPDPAPWKASNITNSQESSQISQIRR